MEFLNEFARESLLGSVTCGYVGACISHALLESPVKVFVGGAMYAIVYRHITTAEFGMGIGPYTSVNPNRLSPSRWAQRKLINLTRNDVRTEWFPLSLLHDAAPKRVSDNGHPVSGAVRDAARRLITSAVNAIGATKYELSPAEQSRAEQACHEHFAVGDLYRERANDKPTDKSVIVGVDIDYYIRDMQLLAGLCRPMIFHTFSPITVAGRDGESHFSITNNLVRYGVSGGSEWSHRVWNWCAYGEFIESPATNTVIQNLLAWFGIVRVVYHKVHHSRPWTDCPNRALVWLIPQYTCYKFSFIASDLRARRLSYMKFSDDGKPGWNRVAHVSADGERLINLGRAGEDATVTLPKVHFDVLMGMKTNQSVTTRMIHLGYTDPVAMCLISQYYSGVSVQHGKIEEVGRPIGVKVHWPASIEVDVPEISSRCYAAPLVSDANLMPMIKRWEAMSRTIDVRVTYVANRTVPSAKYEQFAAEFVSFVVPVAGAGVPYSLEDTAGLLDKPSQKLAIQAVWETLDVRVRHLIEAFLKNEPTMKNGRTISSFADARFLLQFSAFTLSFRDNVLHAEHNKHWFCPGLTPVQLASKVCDYVATVGSPLEGDFSNFDGTVPAWAHRTVMNAVYHRWFASGFQSELTIYTNMLINCPARAKSFGFMYDAGVGVKSGSPTTCDLNTVLNAYMQYCAVRMCNGLLTPREAFNTIGLAFGDDSLFDQQYARSFGRVAGDIGMKLKLEKYDPTIGVCFLARVFPDPLNTTTSFQDPLRTWRKLHLTARDPNVPIGSAALDRVAGYLITDGFTPVTSNYCRMVERYYQSMGDCESLAKRTARANHLVERPYWSASDAWPQAIEDRDIMLQCIAARVGVDVAKLIELESYLDECTNAWAERITINRDGEPNPYVDTILEDGTPSEAVDARVVAQQRAAHHQRAKSNRAPPTSSASSDSGNGSGSATSRRDRRREFNRRRKVNASTAR